MNSNIQIKGIRNIALMRLRDRSDQSVKNMFNEHFWPIETWPDHIVNSFVDFKYKDRIRVCNFFFGNGLQMNFAFSAINFYHSWNETTKKQYQYTFENLWLRIENAIKHNLHNWHHIVSSYYFYSMISRTVMYFDCHIRIYGQKIIIVNNANISDYITIPHLVDKANNPIIQIVKNCSYRSDVHRAERLERRWKFLQSMDDDPIIIDGLTFKFDRNLYTNIIN